MARTTRTLRRGDYGAEGEYYRGFRRISQCVPQAIFHAEVAKGPGRTKQYVLSSGCKPTIRVNKSSAPQMVWVIKDGRCLRSRILRSR